MSDHDSAAIRAATTLRQAGTLLALIGAAGVVLWIWFQAEGQQEVGEPLIDRKYTTALGADDLTERLAVIAAMLPLLLQSAVVATFGLACRAVGHYVRARVGASLAELDEDDDPAEEADAA